MIFVPDLAAAVLRGEKTETRRPISPNPRSPWRRSPLTHRLGFDFAVQPGQGKPTVCRAVVTERSLERLHTVTPADARAEGFPTRTEYVDAWRELYGAWNPDETVHVIRWGPVTWTPAARAFLDSLA